MRDNWPSAAAAVAAHSYQWLPAMHAHALGTPGVEEGAQMAL